MGNMFSSPIQNAYQPQSHASNTQIIHSAKQDRIQEDIESRDYSSREKNVQRIDDYLSPFLPKTHLLKPNLNTLIGISTALLFYVIFLKKEVNNQSIHINEQSRQIQEQAKQITALNERFAAFENKHFYLKEKKPFLTGLEDKHILHAVHNPPTQGIIEVGLNMTLNRVHAFAQLIILKEPNLQLTLPAANTLSPGLSFKFFGAFTRSAAQDGRCLIKAMEGSEKSIKLGNNHEKGSISVNSGEYVELVPDTKNNYWYAANRNAVLDLIPSFEASLGENGWQRLPSGMIMQWGRVLTDINGASRVTFPIEFPSNFLVIHGTPWAGGPGSTVEWAQTRSTKGVTLYTSNNGATGAGWTVYWTAMGY